MAAATGPFPATRPRKLALRPDGSFTYTPNQGFVGTDTFSYLAHDTRGATDVATATITVAQALTRHAVADIDGNATTDLSVYRPSNGAW